MVLFFASFYINTVLAEGENPVPEPINITLKVYAGDTDLLGGPKTISIIACPESLEINAPVTLNGKCAIEQSGLSNSWTWYDENFHTESDLPKTLGVLDELGGKLSDNTNYIYWGWFSDLNYGTVALNKHPLHTNEELLLTYNSYPLRISASSYSGIVGDTITFSAEEKSSFSEDFSNMIWTPSQGVLITMGTSSCTTVADGTCLIILDTVGSINAIGSKTLYVPSTITLTVSPTPAEDGGGGGGSSTPKPKFSAEDALTYLKSIQDADGSFGDSDLYTDWAAIAYGAGDVSGSPRNSLLEYFNSNNEISSLITDNERRAMALLALGENPYSFNDTNYIEAIADEFDETQFGDDSLVNDDIFALIPLSKAGYDEDDSIITKTIDFIIYKQEGDGSWEGSVDITAAAIQALLPFQSVAGVSGALANAETYLINTQEEDGGWGNVSSTSWVMQAENILNASWTKNGKNGLDYLAGMQKNADNNGAMLPSSDSSQNIIWATSYAIPAGLGKPWGEIMERVSRPKIEDTEDNSSRSSRDDDDSKDSKDEETEEIILPSEETNIVAPNAPIVQEQIAKIQEIKKLPSAPKKEIPLEVEKSEEPTTDVFTATAVNALPPQTSQNIPIILGTVSGIVLLFALLKLLAIF